MDAPITLKNPAVRLGAILAATNLKVTSANLTPEWIAGLLNISHTCALLAVHNLHLEHRYIGTVTVATLFQNLHSCDVGMIPGGPPKTGTKP